MGLVSRLVHCGHFEGLVYDVDVKVLDCVYLRLCSDLLEKFPTVCETEAAKVRQHPRTSDLGNDHLHAPMAFSPTVQISLHLHPSCALMV